MAVREMSKATIHTHTCIYMYMYMYLSLTDNSLQVHVKYIVHVHMHVRAISKLFLSDIVFKCLCVLGRKGLSATNFAHTHTLGEMHTEWLSFRYMYMHVLLTSITAIHILQIQTFSCSVCSHSTSSATSWPS